MLKTIDTAEAIKRQQELLKQCFIDGNSIVLMMPHDEPYPIPLSECDSYAKILGLQLHLLDKNWMTTELVELFVLLVCEHHNLPIQHPLVR